MDQSTSSLKNVLSALNHIGSVSATNQKKETIESYSELPYFKTICEMALDPQKKYKVTSVEYISNSDIANIDNCLQYLDELSSQRGVSKQDKLKLSLLASVDKETVEVINKIVKKDLRCGAGIKLFNGILDINVHKPMGCSKIISRFLASAKTVSNIRWQTKLNGVRVWIKVYQNNEISYISRSGHIYNNFHILDPMVLCLKNNLSDEYKNDIVIFDGEVISADKNFQKEMSQVRRIEDVDSSIFRLGLFDFVRTDKKLSDRRTILNNAYNESISKKEDLSKIHVLELNKLKSESLDDAYNEIIDIIDYYVDVLGEEGIVLKLLDSPYEFKKDSKYWCKGKKFETLDLPVIGWEFGNGKNSNRIGKFVCMFNGKEVRIGSGIPDNERDDMENIPKIIEVRYQSITEDGSLWFPSYVRRRDDK